MDLDIRFDDYRIEGEGLVATDGELREALQVVLRGEGDAHFAHTDNMVIFRLEVGWLMKGNGPVSIMEPGDYVITRFGLARFVHPPDS